jgi:ribosomal protein L35
MARQKTRKTLVKRVRETNPKGNRTSKLLINQAGRHHLKTKRSRVSKRRKLARVALSDTHTKLFKKEGVNL